MTDPVSRAARRQNTLDRLAEHLTDWGCPADTVTTRAQALLHEVEQAGWSLPTVDVPALAGRGSTPEGRQRARLILTNRLRGCVCATVDDMSKPPAQHPDTCPVNGAGGTVAQELTSNPASSPADMIDSGSAPQGPGNGFRHGDESTIR
jgi:hypothetical protein